MRPSAATSLASRRVGGLIVIEREQGLRNYIETGIAIDALLSYDLILSIFSPRSPLHDGAIVMLHDASEHDDFEPASVRALPELLRLLDEREWRSVGLDTLLGVA